jgi:hypothetical protein
MRRTINVLAGNGPQESFFYDHPFFGQIVLASSLSLIGYPNSLNVTSEPSSIESLYVAPRILMGLFAVFDTFLIFKIAEKKYGNKVAFLASILFAVMPFTWVFRRILLDSILLPFLLSSILFALYSKESNHKYAIVLLSGIFLGLAIFTKIPAFVFIPLTIAIIYFNNKDVKQIGLWLIPVILIPLIWPVYSLQVDQFDLWSSDVLWQTQRQDGGFPGIVKFFVEIDPVLFFLGLFGLVFAAVRKDWFILLWSMPMVLFLGLIGFTQYFHWIPIIPAFCVAASILIIKLIEKLKDKVHLKVYSSVTAAIVIFGLLFTSALITTNVSSTQFEAISFVLDMTREGNFTILASPVYSWVFYDIFDRPNVMLDYAMVLYGDPPTDNILLIADNHFKIDTSRGKQLQLVYEQTKMIKNFQGNVINFDTELFPYTSMKFNFDGHDIQIRTSEKRNW